MAPADNEEIVVTSAAAIIAVIAARRLRRRRQRSCWVTGCGLGCYVDRMIADADAGHSSYISKQDTILRKAITADESRLCVMACASVQSHIIFSLSNFTRLMK